jgi:hypothetical protein
MIITQVVGRTSKVPPKILVRISRLLFWVFVNFQLISCATDKNRPEKTSYEVVILEKSPSLIQGEPVPNADMAVDLAELALTQKGIDCRGFVANVSFFEDVYRVFFESKDKSKGSQAYRVDINAKTSEILKAVRLEK